MKRNVYTDGNGSRHILVQGLGEYSPKRDHDKLVEQRDELVRFCKALINSRDGDIPTSNGYMAIVDVDDLLHLEGFIESITLKRTKE